MSPPTVEEHEAEGKHRGFRALFHRKKTSVKDIPANKVAVEENVDEGEDMKESSEKQEAVVVADVEEATPAQAASLPAEPVAAEEPSGVLETSAATSAPDPWTDAAEAESTAPAEAVAAAPTVSVATSPVPVSLPTVPSTPLAPLIPSSTSCSVIASQICSLLQPGPPFYDADDDAVAADLIRQLSKKEVMNGAALAAATVQPTAPSNVWSSLALLGDVDDPAFGSVMLSIDLACKTPIQLESYSLITVPRDEPKGLQSNGDVHVAALWPPSTWWPWKEPKKSEPGGPTKQVRVWHPSKTRVSLHVAWWGFSIYLPPPMMKEIDSDIGDVTKTTAVISTVLSFVLNHIDTVVKLAPGLAAAVAVAKAIVPIIGYISTFISWSWTAIKSFDKGNGVVLSATWLLPIAILPRTWDAPDAPADATKALVLAPERASEA